MAKKVVVAGTALMMAAGMIVALYRQANFTWLPAVGLLIAVTWLAYGQYRLRKTAEAELALLRKQMRLVEESNQGLHERIRELSALHQTAAMIGSTLNLREILNLIIDLSSKVLRFSAGFVIIPSEEGAHPQLEVFGGGAASDLLDGSLCREMAIEVAAKGYPRLVRPLARVLKGETLPLDSPGEDSLYLVPLMVQGQAQGVMGLTCCSDSLEEMEGILNIFVSQAAIAISNARLYQKVEYMAITDGLTGLFNHRHFHDVLEQEVYRSEKLQRPVSVMIIDVDDFKAINDRFGHLAGDQVLRELADVIRGGLRSSDLVARYGGEEFGVILPGADERSAREVAEKLRHRVAQRSFDVAGHQLGVTLSVGVASYPVTARNKDELIRCADQAAYYAKESGKNQVCSFLDIKDLAGPLAGEETPSPEGATPQALGRMHLDTIRALSYMVDAKDHYTYGHSTRVEKYAVEIGRRLGLGTEELQVLQRAALLHDIGKMGISEHILRKENRLTPTEMEIIRHHPAVGAQILGRIGFLQELIPTVYHHHEWFDGSGYPAGLKGEEIPLGARIIAVADAFEAMTAYRHYRGPRSFQEAIADLKKGAGTQFDPRIVDIFVDMVKQPEQAGATT